VQPATRGCLICGDGVSDCPHSGYSPRRIAFVKAHLEAYRSAYLNPNRAAASNELARLEVEFKTLLPRHNCTCFGHHCYECGRLARQRVNAPAPVEIGRGSRVEPPMPSATMLDLERAFEVVGREADSADLARYMSRDGVVTTPRQHPVVIPTELICLLCGRPGARGQRQCTVCGGSLVLDAAIDAA
jgi:hypothetical protein